MASGSTFISRYRQATTEWLASLNGLLALREQYDALDYGNTLTQDDFAGSNADLTVADLTAAVSSVAAINTTFQSGHDTNLYKLRL